MYVSFKITENQYNIVCKALRFCSAMCSFRFTEGLEMLYADCFTEDIGNPLRPDWKEAVYEMQKFLYPGFQKDDYSNIESKASAKLDVFIDKFTKAKETAQVPDADGVYWFDVDMTEDEVILLQAHLDLPLRIAAGQWDRLKEFLMLTSFEHKPWKFEISSYDDMVIDYYKNKSVDIYQKKGFTTYASFGIFAKEFSEDVRELYDFYKVFMYEAGVKGVYSSTVSKAANTSSPLPIIDFPYEHIDTCEGSIDGFKDRWKGRVDQEPLKIFSDKPDVVYLPIREYTYVPVRKGNIVYRKRNGYYVVR